MLESQRHLLHAYEYLCHVGEAKQWLEAVLAMSSIPKRLSVTELEQTLRDGVILAKLARRFLGAQAVPKIFIHPKLQYRHSDNINYFFRFVRHVGLPELFIFELVDLYNAKNLPKVIYCIHVLSHLLAKRGMAARIANLVGKLEFSNDQLEQTNAGLVGKSMPNFGNINRELAKEINEEPEPEPESERQDRELAEVEPEVIKLQAQCRAHLSRQNHYNLRKELYSNLDRWMTIVQASCRATLVRQRHSKTQEMLGRLEFLWIGLQAHGRGTLVRRRHRALCAAASRVTNQFVGLQSLVRARAVRQEVKERHKQLGCSTIEISGLQARIRGLLSRRRFFEPIHRLDVHERSIIDLQAIIRSRLVRARVADQVVKLLAAEEDTVGFQAMIRGSLARKSLLEHVRALQTIEPTIIGFQACCNGALVRRQHAQKSKALHKLEVRRGVGGLQAFVRAGMVRKKIESQKKELDFVAPDVVGIQAQCRGVLARVDWGSWFEHLRGQAGWEGAVYLQSLIRGLLVRRMFFERLIHYHHHLDKVVKVQSVFRSRQAATQYRHLQRKVNVPIGAIKAFLHLLSDSDADYEEEIALGNLRTGAVRAIRDNQELESHVNELDTKIALLVKNKISLDELQSHSRRRRELVASKRNSVLAAAGDVFAVGANVLEKGTKKKLELYQQFFYLLQTKPEYLARLLFLMKNCEEKIKKVVEGVVLTLFGYAQMRREEYLLLKLFQRSIHEELAGVNSLSEFVMGDFTFVKLMVQYGRGAKERKYLKDLLSPVICEIVKDDVDLNVETDPIKIYRSVISNEETRTGIQSSRPLDVTFNQALADKETCALFIKHLQSLRALTDRFLYAITESTKRMPFGIRYIAREIFRGLQVKFESEPEDALAKVVLHMIYYRYLQPAVVAPETYDVVDSVIGPLARKNLAEVSKMLNQISVGRLFSDENPYLVPLNEYVTHATTKFGIWFNELVQVEDAEIHFAVDEYLDHTVSTKPTIFISPNEIYSTHSLVLSDLDRIAPGKDDPLRAVVLELGGAPSAASAELDQARAGEIALNLENRLAVNQDPEAEMKALWVKTKRYVLAMLKVQPRVTLMDAFLEPVNEEHEDEWARIVMEEVEWEQRRIGRRVDERPAGNTLEDVHSLSFQELKARTLENVLELEKLGKLSREDNYQGILDSLAKDILQRNRRRIQRRVDMAMLANTLAHLQDKQRYLEEQEAQYNAYISDSMAGLQKKGIKKKFVMPFTPQWHHLRSLEKKGRRKPTFGSYKYSAQRLYEKGILLSIDQFSPKQFDKVSLIISCDQVGVFKLEAQYVDEPVRNGSVELRMEDLLEAQFAGRQSVRLEVAKLNLNLLLYLIKLSGFCFCKGSSARDVADVVQMVS
ncbi:hypothetical protein CROQUDRAFT_47337 [Cronartium quercuum f. sp. fusiforme G11]|uniref:Ras GTPase-activating-like protein IQGAP1 n=1 Tax=Cronartium quercuum f. sp. fusiforme G11 TaxID=708437 RepID=A0A9P6TBA6_9BASI|nr:hypothetical protein CROQUDRAFT_47337 [Cronartium quercuum f. sp. fusiforme G11]